MCCLQSFWPNAIWDFLTVLCWVRSKPKECQTAIHKERVRYQILCILSFFTHLIFSINGEDSVPLVQKFTGVCNVDCCLLFVSCQHPDFYPSFSERHNSVRYSILQAIFNPCCSWENRKIREIIFFLLKIKLLFSCLKKALCFFKIMLLNLLRIEPRFCPTNKHTGTWSAFGLRSECVIKFCLFILLIARTKHFISS